MSARAVMFNRKVLWWLEHGDYDWLPRMRFRHSCWRVTDPGLADRLARAMDGAP